MGRYDDERRDRGRRSRGWDDAPPARPCKSLVVTWLGVFQILAGGFVLVGGMCGFLIVWQLGSEGGKLGALGLPGIGGGAAFAQMFILTIFLWSTGTTSAGIGVVARAAWARFASLLLAGFSGAVGLIYTVACVLGVIFQGVSTEDGQIVAVSMSFLGAALFLTHCVWSYLVLLQPKYAREFE